MNEARERMDPAGAAAFAEIAEAVLAAEDASDAAMAAAGMLLARTAANRIVTGVPVMAAQRVVDQIERMVISQFDSRRALLAAHGSLSAIARRSRSGSEVAWGPDSSCPQEKTGSTELRAVA